MSKRYRVSPKSAILDSRPYQMDRPLTLAVSDLYRNNPSPHCVYDLDLFFYFPKFIELIKSPVCICFFLHILFNTVWPCNLFSNSLQPAKTR